MQKYLSIIFILVFEFCFITQNFSQKHSIQGTVIPRKYSDYVYLIKGKQGYKDINDLVIVDSAKIIKGKFTFDYQYPYTDYYSIRFKDLGRSFYFFGEKGTTISMNIDTADFYNPSMKGSRENDLRISFGRSTRPLIFMMNSYVDSATRYSKDTFQRNEYDRLNYQWALKIRQANLNFIRKEPNSFQALTLLAYYYFSFSEDSVKYFIKQLSPSLRKNPMADEILFNKFTRPSILKDIKTFYDLKLIDTLKEVFPIETLKGKLVLIDFWGSWCTPCINNFPKLNDLLIKYRDKGFEIVGISLDLNHKIWKNSVNKWQIPWISLSELKGEQSISSVYYNIEYLPTYILIGRDGKIIQSHISDKEIQQLVEANL